MPINLIVVNPVLIMQLTGRNLHAIHEAFLSDKTYKSLKNRNDFSLIKSIRD